MSASQPARVPAGVRTGGGFAATGHADPGTDLLERSGAAVDRELFDRFGASARHWGNRLVTGAPVVVPEVVGPVRSREALRLVDVAGGAAAVSRRWARDPRDAPVAALFTPFGRLDVDEQRAVIRTSTGPSQGNGAGWGPRPVRRRAAGPTPPRWDPRSTPPGPAPRRRSGLDRPRGHQYLNGRLDLVQEAVASSPTSCTPSCTVQPTATGPARGVGVTDQQPATTPRISPVRSAPDGTGSPGSPPARGSGRSWVGQRRAGGAHGGRLRVRRRHRRDAARPPAPHLARHRGSAASVLREEHTRATSRPRRSPRRTRWPVPAPNACGRGTAGRRSPERSELDEEPADSTRWLRRRAAHRGCPAAAAGRRRSMVRPPRFRWASVSLSRPERIRFAGRRPPGIGVGDRVRGGWVTRRWVGWPSCRRWVWWSRSGSGRR